MKAASLQPPMAAHEEAGTDTAIDRTFMLSKHNVDVN